MKNTSKKTFQSIEQNEKSLKTTIGGTLSSSIVEVEALSITVKVNAPKIYDINAN